MTCPNLPRAAAALLLATAALGAGAQTPAKPAKPAPAATAAAAAPAAPAEGKTLSLSGSGAGTGKVMSRDELRACLKQQDTFAERRNEVESAKAPLDREKEALAQEQEALKAERSKVDEAQAAVRDLNAKYKAYAERVAAWNERAKAVADRTGNAADRERNELDRERAALSKLQPELEAERAKIGDGPQQIANVFNAKASALDQKVADWNRRNAALSVKARTLNEDRELWAGECASRRYREDDEIAIRRGQ